MTMAGQERLPKLTVFMPVYNTGPYLSEAIESVLAQTYEDFEFLIIDDGSTDDSLAIITQFAAADKRIRVYSRGNKGRPATRNEGLLMARGELLALMDSDDRSAPERLAEQVRLLEANPDFIACGTAMEYFGEKTGRQRPPVDPDLVNIAMLFTPSIYNATALMRREQILRHDIAYRESDLQAQDFRFWSRVAEVGRITNISKVLYFYRAHPAQASQAQRQSQLQIHKNIVAEKLNRIGLSLTEAELTAFLLDELRGDDISARGMVPAEGIALVVGVFGRLLALNAEKRLFDGDRLRSYLCRKLENICLLFGLEGVLCGIRMQSKLIRLRSTVVLFARLVSRWAKGMQIPRTPR
ncbi:glycosyltransferase family 2 protein [Thiovibrio sp. JS02]